MSSGPDHLVEILPLSGFDQPLTYEVPLPFRGRVEIGSLVRISLGRRQVQGIVTSLAPERPPGLSKIKSLISPVREEPVLTPDLVALAKWISGYYAARWETVLEAMIPAAVRDGAKEKLRRRIEVNSEVASEDADALVARAPKQAQLIEFLRKQSVPAPRIETLKALGIGAAACDVLVEKGLVLETAERVNRTAYDDEFSVGDEVAREPPVLTQEQEEAAVDLVECVKSDEFVVRLLQGVTGSGKTEVYFAAMKEALLGDGSVLFLVPEVALAPQTVSRLRSRFADDTTEVVVWHSHLSSGERLDAWSAVASGRARIVVGARSAVFCPLRNLKLIVVDEEHEPAYKQEDTPRYQGRDVAVYRAMLADCACVLGSATPSLESIRNVRSGKYGLLELKKRIDGCQLPLVHIVDMRREALRRDSSGVLSRPLLDALRQRVASREQSILFLNRRGFNTTMLCPDCGHVEQCKDCSISMTFHRTDGLLRCHLCGHQRNAPRFCPSCNSLEIRRKGHGTQRIEDMARDALPKRAKVVRIDADVMTRKNLFRKILADFRRGKIDVLVGTQMIAKGLDFPNVTLVGVVDADLPLRMEDFRASERAFQLIVQVAGRAGRGDRAGEVFVQSFAPHAPSIQYARSADLEGFLADELEQREQFAYPPYRHLVRHLFRCRNEEKAAFYAEQWIRFAKERLPSGVETRGPAPAPIEKMKGFYRYHIWYFTEFVSSLVPALEKLRDSFPMDKEVIETIDVDPVNLG